MRALVVQGIFLIGIVAFANTTLQDDFGSTTGHLVKTLVKANWLMQKHITEEINSAHEYVNVALLDRLKLGNNDTKVEDLKDKMKNEFVTMLNIDQDCTSTSGILWFANRALRAAEKYRELYIRADLLEICGWDNWAAINSICRTYMDRYKRAVENIETNVVGTFERFGYVFDTTMGCLRFRYNSLLKSIERKSF